MALQHALGPVIRQSFDTVRRDYKWFAMLAAPFAAALGVVGVAANMLPASLGGAAGLLASTAIYAFYAIAAHRFIVLGERRVRIAFDNRFAVFSLVVLAENVMLTGVNALLAPAAPDAAAEIGGARLVIAVFLAIASIYLLIRIIALYPHLAVSGESEGRLRRAFALTRGREGAIFMKLLFMGILMIPIGVVLTLIAAPFAVFAGIPVIGDLVLGVVGSLLLYIPLTLYIALASHIYMALAGPAPSPPSGAAA